MRVELIDTPNGLRISVGASYVEKESVKAIPGSSWRDDHWTVPATWAACLALRGTYGERLDVGPRLAAWSVQERDNRVLPCMELRRAVTSGQDYDPRLKDFQQAGVEWLLKSADGALLGDDVGAGKTVQLCVALKVLGVKRGIIVAPKSTLPAWRDHLRDWAGLRGSMVVGSAAQRRKAIEMVAAGLADVAIIAWENIRLHSSIAGFGSIALTDADKALKELNHLDHEFVIADEAQKAKAPQSKMSRALWALGDAPSVRVRYAATATPIGNALDDLWAIMRFVSPAEWPVKGKFVDRYCEMTWNKWGGMEVGGTKADTASELFGFFDPRYRVMPKDVVLKDLPPTLGGINDPNGPMIRWAEMGTKQAKAYKQMLEESLADIDGGRLLAIGGMQKAGRLLQLASAYGDVTHTTGLDGKIKQHLTLAEPSCKLDVMEELLTGELSAEEAVVVFTVSRQLAVLAAERAEKVTGRRSALIVGGQSDYEREEVIRDFQAGKIATVVATVQAGGAGITLTKARAEIILQRDFSYINNVQVEGRVHRIGSEVHDRVLYYDVITPDTPDLHVLDVLRSKKDIASEVSRLDDLRMFLLSGTR